MCQYLIKMTYGGVKVLEYSVCPCIDIVSSIYIVPGGPGGGGGVWLLVLDFVFAFPLPVLEDSLIYQTYICLAFAFLICPVLYLSCR